MSTPAQAPTPAEPFAPELETDIHGTTFRLGRLPVTDTGVTYQPSADPGKLAQVLERAAKITNAQWRKGWKPSGSVPPKVPCLYHGRAIPADSGPVAELKRTRGEVPREWAYLEVHPPHALGVGDSAPWCVSGGGWGGGTPYARTGQALEWACGCITTYSGGTRHCRSGHLAGGDYHGREWVFACSALHLEIYAGYALRSYWEPIKLEPMPPEKPKPAPRGWTSHPHGAPARILSPQVRRAPKSLRRQVRILRAAPKP